MADQNPYETLDPQKQQNPYEQIDPAKPAEPDVSITLGQRAIDLARGVVGGARDAVQMHIDTAAALPSPLTLAERGVRAITGTSVPGGEEIFASPEITAPQFSEAEQNITVAGEITRQATKFIIGMAGAGKAALALPGVAKLAARGVAGRLGVQAIQGAAADLATADPYAARVSDLIESVPSLENPVTGYLASDPTDSFAEAKLKTALEGTIIGGLVGGVFEGLKATKAAFTLRAAGKVKEADAVMAKAAAQAEESLVSGGGKPIEPALPTVTVDAMGEAVTKVVDKNAFVQKMAFTGTDDVLQGTLNYTKLDTTDSVKGLISTLVATAKRDLPDLAGSVQTQRETVQLAQILGRDPSDLVTSLAGLRFDSEDMAAHLVAGKGLIRRVAADLYPLAERIGNNIASGEDRVLFAHMTDVLASTMDHVAGIQTAAARATAAGRIRIGADITSGNLSDLLERVGGNEQIIKLAQKLRMAQGDAAGTIAAMKTSFAQKATDVMNFVWINGVLGGIKTSIVNVTTTGMNSLLMPGYRMVGGIVQEIGGSAGGREQFMKGWMQYRTLRHTLLDSLDYASRAWKANSSILDPTSMQAEGLGKMHPIADLASGEWTKWLAKGLENLIGAPGRFLTTQDEFFKQISYRSHVMADAYVDGMAQGRAGRSLLDYANLKVAQSFGDTGRALDKTALGAAKAATFTQDLAAAHWIGTKTVGEVASSAAASHPFIKGFMLPFTKVPTNLIRQTVDMTPGLAFIRKQVVEDIKAGGERGAMALGKQGIGLGLIGAAGMLAYEGRLTGSGPSDPQLRAQLGADWQPYSVWISTNADGTRNYLSLARLDPFGTFFSLIGDFAERGAHMDDLTKADIAEKLLLGVMKNIASKTYLRGLADAATVLGGQDERKVETWLRQRAASFVPGYVSVLKGDDGLKDAQSMMDAVKAKLPFFSQSVPYKRDNFGEKVQPPMGYPWSSINPFTLFRTSDDPARLALADLARTDSEARFSLPKPVIAGTQAHGIDLRAVLAPNGQSAYDRLMELHGTLELNGKTLHESMNELVTSPAYLQARERMGQGSAVYRGSLAVQLVRQRFDMYERVAMQKVYEEYPGLREAVIGFKVSSKVSKVDPKSPAVQPLDQLKQLTK